MLSCLTNHHQGCALSSQIRSHPSTATNSGTNMLHSFRLCQERMVQHQRQAQLSAPLLNLMTPETSRCLNPASHQRCTSTPTMHSCTWNQQPLHLNRILQARPRPWTSLLHHQLPQPPHNHCPRSPLAAVQGQLRASLVSSIAQAR